MKVSQFRKLIREEVRKIVREVTTKVPSDGIVRDHKGKPQVKFTKKGNGTEVKAIATGKTFMTPMSVDQAYNKLFSVGQIMGNDGSSFNGIMHKTFNDDLYDLDPSDWKPFLTKERALSYKVGDSVVVDNLEDYPFKVKAIFPNKAKMLADVQKMTTPDKFKKLVKYLKDSEDDNWDLNNPDGSPWVYVVATGTSSEDRRYNEFPFVVPSEIVSSED